MTLPKKSILFIITTLTIHFLLLILFRHQSNKRDLYQNFHSYKKNKGIKTLFMGYSIVERSIDVSILDSTYSLAFSGENNRLNYYKLISILKEKQPKPKYIVLPCDIVTFVQNVHYSYTNKPFYYAITPFYEIKYLQKNPLNSYYDYLKTSIFPYIYWKQAVGLTNAGRYTKAKNNFANLTAKEKINSCSKFMNEADIAGRVDYIYYPKSLLYLQKTIELCKANNIKLIFIKYPLTNTFIQELKKEIGDSLFSMRPSEKIIKQSNIPILNYETLYINHDEYFYDSHHINEVGKKAFSTMLKLKLDSLYKVY